MARSRPATEQILAGAEDDPRLDDARPRAARSRSPPPPRRPAAPPRRRRPPPDSRRAAPRILPPRSRKSLRSPRTSSAAWLSAANSAPREPAPQPPTPRRRRRRRRRGRGAPRRHPRRRRGARLPAGRRQRDHPGSAPGPHAARAAQPARSRQSARRGPAGGQPAAAARLARRAARRGGAHRRDRPAARRSASRSIGSMRFSPMSRPIGLPTDRAGAGRLDPEILDGVVKGARRRRHDQDPQSGAAAARRVRADRRLGGRARRRERDVRGGRHRHRRRNRSGRRRSSASTSAAQEYALPLDRVREIMPVPEHVSEIAGSETAVLGVVTLRDRLLPLVSLRALLGLPRRGRSRRARQGHRRCRWETAASASWRTARAKSCASIRPDRLRRRPC